MRLHVLSFLLVFVSSSSVSLAFAPLQPSSKRIVKSPTSFVTSQTQTSFSLFMDDETSIAIPDRLPSGDKGGKKLGLITFDLDDTLFPIEPVIEEANAAFSKAMENFGYEGINPRDITFTSQSIREEMECEDVPVTYTEMRLRAIRFEMERYITKHKLQQIAVASATTVESLHHAVVAAAERGASRAVHSSVVQMVYNAWELERHFSAERHLYPDVLDMLQTIKDSNPGVIIGAITDGKANPLVMENTLSPYFDFCVSWEDEDVFPARKPNPKIFEAALDRYKSLTTSDSVGDRSLWVHVGDDLAYDVGGSAACGAKTIWADLIDDYGQTAKLRLEGIVPSWSTALPTELKKRNEMANEARNCVDSRVTGLYEIPEAIKAIIKTRVSV